MTDSLRQRIKEGEILSGILVRIPNEELVEIAAASGVDFIVLDCEHGPHDVAAVRQHIAAAKYFGAQTLVRVGAGDQSLILRALDAGAVGIVSPHVDTVADAQELVKRASYPPLGERGFALYSRAADYAHISPEEHKRRTQDALLLIAMLESPQAGSNAAEILSVDGLHGFMIGTSDLAASTTAQDPSVEETKRRIESSGRDMNSIRFDIVNSVDEGESAIANGAQVLVYNTTALVGSVFHQLRELSLRHAMRREQ